MANRGSYSIFVLISIFFYVPLDVVLSQAPYQSTFFDVNPEKDFGIQIEVNGVTENRNQLVVNIYSDSHTDSAQKFFTSQISGNILQQISYCKAIQIKFNPCTISTIDNSSGKLSCPNGVKQCNDDEIIVCVENSIENDAVEMAKFMECYFSKPDLINECVGKTNVRGTYKDCRGDDSKYQLCNTFSSRFKDLIKTAGEKKWPSGKAIDGFKDALCNKLKDNTKECRAFCP